MRKLLILLLVLMMMIPAALAEVAVTRSVTTAGLVTYTVTGVSGTYGILIDDAISGGCRLSDGTTRIMAIILNPDTTKSYQLTLPTSGTCTLHGSWDYGTEKHAEFPDATVSSSGAVVIPPTCTAGASEACTNIDGCVGTRTCGSDGFWSNCVKTDANCGIAGYGQPSGTGYVQQTYGSCSYMQWAAAFSQENYCTVGWCIVIGGGVVIYLLLKKKR